MTRVAHPGLAGISIVIRRLCVELDVVMVLVSRITIARRMPAELQKRADRYPKKDAEHPGILDPLEAAQRFRLTRYLPSAELAPFVEHHWTIHWDLRGRPPYVSEVLPHPSVNVAFTDERGWITGVTTGKYTYEVRDLGLIVGTMFRPGGFFPFWRRPVTELTDQVIPVTDVFTTAGDDFRRSLLAHDADEERIARLEDLLRAQGATADRNLDLVRDALDAIGSHRGLRTVAGVAERVHVSARTLQNVFRKYVGVGLKWVLMRYRLIEAAELAARTSEPDWAGIAVDLGYTDQSHFVNDFKKLVGQPPHQYTHSIRSSPAP